MNMPANIIAGLCDICRKQDINKLILFGSRANDTNHERSDIDLAAYFDSTSQYFDFHDAVYNLPTLLMFDIVDLNSPLISTEIKSEIKNKGIVLYEKI